METKISFINNRQTIVGTLITPEQMEGKVPGVIFFHGGTSSEKNYIPLAQRISEKGIAGLTINMQGHGTSEGDFNALTFNDFVSDGVSSYDFLTAHNFIDQQRIGICGASMGAGIAALVSKQRAIKSLVLRAPATYTQEMMFEVFNEVVKGEINKFYKMKDIEKTPAIQALEDFTGSLLIISSEKDEIIPENMVQAFLASAQNAQEKEHITIKNATHQLTEDLWREEFRREAIKWFLKTLSL